MKQIDITIRLIVTDDFRLNNANERRQLINFFNNHCKNKSMFFSENWPAKNRYRAFVLAAVAAKQVGSISMPEEGLANNPEPEVADNWYSMAHHFISELRD